MGRDVSGGQAAEEDIFFEHRLSDHLMRFFAALGAPCERIEVLPGRDNVLAAYDAGHPTRTIMLDAHQDTVPVEGMTIAPFSPLQREGKIFGRGAADVKGSMAAMLHAFARLYRERPPGAANVILSCSCDEEATAQGVQQLVRCWQSSPSPSRLLFRPPTAAIVAEPTELDVVVAHRGVVRFMVETRGRACHSSQTELGENAIYTMATVVSRLAAMARTLEGSTAVHPLCGGPRLSVGRIEGGIAVNIVPDRCAIQIDRRLIPGEDPETVWEQLREQFGDLDAKVLRFHPPWLKSPALGDQSNGPLADHLLRCADQVCGGGKRKIGVPFCTNAAAVSAAGVPTVVFGPGSIDQAHTADEFIEIDQLDAAAEIYYRFLAND